MTEFDTSKGFQDLLMTEPTRDLLIAERNADLEYRENIKTLQFGQEAIFDGDRIKLISGGHILGSVQTSVELPDGIRVGYSGDFRWPLESVIEVDWLVVDSTYGAPDRIRQYTQKDVEERFVELVVKQLHVGSLRIKAHRGTLQRALELLAGCIDVPIVGTQAICKEAEVYRRWGYCLEPILQARSEEAKTATKGKHVSVYGTMERWPEVTPGFSTIVLSAFMVGPKDPVTSYSGRAFRVAMSDHADFNGTIDYVAATGAKYALTDAVRGARAEELAGELKRKLGIVALASTSPPSSEWGS
jgi:putative mRNA 3-end processing factor